MTMEAKTLRQEVYKLIADDEQSKQRTWTKSIIAALIIFSLGLAVVATEPALMKDHQEVVRKLDLAIALIFLVEFAARVWTSPLTGKFETGIKQAQPAAAAGHVLTEGKLTQPIHQRLAALA